MRKNCWALKQNPRSNDLVGLNLTRVILAPLTLIFLILSVSSLKIKEFFNNIKNKLEKYKKNIKTLNKKVDYFFNSIKLSEKIVNNRLIKNKLIYKLITSAGTEIIIQGSRTESKEEDFIVVPKIKNQMPLLFLKSDQSKLTLDSILPSSRNTPAVINPVSKSEVGEWIIPSSISDQATIFNAISKYLFIFQDDSLSNTNAEDSAITKAIITAGSNAMPIKKLSILATIKNTNNPTIKSLFSFDNNKITPDKDEDDKYKKLSILEAKKEKTRDQTETVQSNWLTNLLTRLNINNHNNHLNLLEIEDLQSPEISYVSINDNCNEMPTGCGHEMVSVNEYELSENNKQNITSFLNFNTKFFALSIIILFALMPIAVLATTDMFGLTLDVKESGVDITTGNITVEVWDASTKLITTILQMEELT